MLSLQDERDIAHVILRYADAMDRHEWDRFLTCFTNDFTADYDGFIMTSGAHMREIMENMYRDLGPALHRITNLAITDTGSEVTARSYVHGLSMAKNGTVAMEAEGYYDDALVKTADGWKTRKRKFTGVRVRDAR